MRKLLIFFLVFSCSWSWSQEAVKIKLQSGIYKLPKKELGIQLQPKQEEIVGDVFYRIMQFYSIPSSREKKVIEEMGIVFLSYLPEKAFIVSIQVQNTIDLKYLNKKVESSAPMSASMKLSKLVGEENFPEYSADGNGIKIVALIYDGLELDILEPYLSVLSKKYKCSFKYFLNDPRIEVTIAKQGILQVASLPFVYHVQTCEAPPELENHRGVSNHRVNTVSNIFPGSFTLTGAGVVVGHGDDGDIGPHIDYRGRLTSIAGPSIGNHGDHVAGTIFGAGNLDPNARGMAPGAEIYYSSYPTNINSIDNHYTQQAVRITSSSYGNGCNAGYTSYSQTMDKDIRDNYALMHVFSCGNSGNSNCNYGAGAGWGNITGGHKQGKNVIATGNVTYQDVISASSSRGPADDGRIKPDLCAIGTAVYSCNSGNVYNSSTGTSMACPGVSGSLALMHEYYKSQYIMDPPGGLLKSVLMNTAEDLGNSGPDFTYGYGRINILRAIETLEDETFRIDTISQGDQDSLLIQVPSGIKELRVMVYWSDKEANPSAAQALVNNLDMIVWDLNNQTQYKPWVLDPTPTAANLNALAVRDVDSLNNVEQVTLMNPGTGYYRVDITGTSVPFGSQEYYIVYYLVEDEVRITHPFGGEFWDPTETQTIRWDAIPGSGTFDLDYSLDSGQTWMPIASGVSANQNNYDWNPASQIKSAHSFVRVTRGTSSSTNEHPFHIMQAPKSLKFDWICGDSARMSWSPVPGASQYVVYQLGNMYMEPIDTFGNSYGILNGLSVNSKYWLSVSALGVDDVQSKRAFAIAKKINFQDCILPVDAGVSMVFPNEYSLSNCQNLDSLVVSIAVKNYGADPLFNIPVNYNVNSTSTVSEVMTDTILSFDSAFYTFNQTYSLTGIGNNFVQGFTTMFGDSNLANDYSSAVNFIHSSGTISLPDTQNFNSMLNCGTASNCGGTTCNLSNSWINDEGDDTDWRVNSGSTPTIGTGPTSGYTGSGKYVYLEAGNCFGSEARMVTPCIDLDSTTYPEVVFAYHMFGNTVGSLHLDVIVDGKIEYDIMPVLSGEQDSNWLTKQVYLTPYVGKTINLQFRGIIGNGNSSDIALDDIIVREANLAIPVSQFSMTPDPACYSKPILFTSTVSTVITDYKWDFGVGSTPSSAIGEGPHTVVYAMNSNPVASLKVTNILGTDSASMAVTFDSIPTAGFTFSTIATQTVQFTNQSSSNSKSWSWSFGDGDTSTVQNPTHVYQNGGNYDVTLYAINDCGQDSLLVNLYVTAIGVDENKTIDDFVVYPNPVDDVLIIERGARNSGLIQIDLWDAMGRILQTHDWNRGGQIRIDMSGFSPGVYIVKINQGVSKSVRIIKN